MMNRRTLWTVTLASLLASPDVRTELGGAAGRYCREHGGATDRSVQAIAERLGADRRHVA